MACKSGRCFAERVVDQLRLIIRDEAEDAYFSGLVDTSEITFANGEFKTVVNQSVRGGDVYIVQSMDDPTSERSVNDNLMVFLTAINAAHEADADRITAVIPQFPYARQERKKAREGITAKMVCRFLEIAGASRVITLDLHAQAVGGFFHQATLDDLRALRPLVAHFQSHFTPTRLTVVSPDVGSANRARDLSRLLGTDMAICDKERDYSKAGVVRSTRLVGEVRGRDVLMVDDMIATGGSILEAARTLKREGANNIYLGCSLPFLNGKAVGLFQEAYQEGLFKVLMAADVVNRDADFVQKNPWYAPVDVSRLFARVIFNINRRRSVSGLL